jgi:tetratricopeptide (TPR) repeat protein
VRQPALATLGLLGLLVLGAGEKPTPVEPSELMKRTDLLGRGVVVDDRVSFFVQSNMGRYYDEVYFKRTQVVFRLPPSLRFEQHPRASAARVQGVLKKVGDLWVCEVGSIELLPPDLDRVNRGVAALPPLDSEGRTAWARWAEQRGKAFDDQALRKRARELDGEAIRIEGERSSARPADWLALAQRARTREVPEPEPSALAHRAFRAQIADARTAAAWKTLQEQIASFFPNAAQVPSGNADLARWDAPYANDPAGAYRQAPEPVREALDHRLWADVTQGLLERQAGDDPAKAVEIADQASSQLPDRPQVAARMLEDGLSTASRQMGTLRQRDVEALASLYRDRLRQPERAKSLLRSWLDEQRKHRLSETDAEGRLALASQYEILIDDRSTAIDLLQEAWKIDPQSKEVADAFLRRNYRRVSDRWVAPARTPTGDEVSTAGTPPPSLSEGSLLRLSPREVRARLGGKPDRIIWSSSQGQTIEQWIYQGPKQVRYVNLIHTPGSVVARVIADYTLPKIVSTPRAGR